MSDTRTPADPTATADGIGSSANVSALPRGRIGRDTRTSNSAGTTTIETVCSVTVTVGASRTLQISACVEVLSDIAGGVQAAIYEDSVLIQRKNSISLGTGQQQAWALLIETQPDAGDHLYELATGASGSDGNTVTCHATADNKVVLYVDDIGPSY